MIEDISKNLKKYSLQTSDCEITPSQLVVMLGESILSRKTLFSLTLMINIAIIWSLRSSLPLKKLDLLWRN